MASATPSEATSALLTPPGPSLLPAGQATLQEAAEALTRSCDIPTWGVDPSTRRVSIAWRTTELGVRTVEFPRLEGGERFAHVWHATRRLVIDLLREDRSRIPALVLVEQPAIFSKRLELDLYMVAGVIAGAIHDALSTWTEPVVATIPVASWKKEAVGYGAAKKGDVFAWARASGYEGTSQDEADSWAIALAAQRRCRRAAA